MNTQLEAGTILLNKYRVEAAIGQGGFGVVYKATDTLLKRTLAIKTLVHDKTDPAATTDDEVFVEFLDRFRREAEVSSFFTANPNIITVYGLEQDGKENYFLLLEYLDGGSLDNLIQDQGRLSVAQTCSIALDLAHALADIHNHPADIVHRDIKPSNVLLRSKGMAVLADFGIAQVGHDSHRTVMGNTARPLRHPGSGPYRSPEQADRYDYLTPASDLYSLGLVIYEMLTGRMYVKQPKLPPSQFNREIPLWLDGIVIKLLQKKLEDRYHTAEELRDDIQAGLAGFGVKNDNSTTAPVRQTAPLNSKGVGSDEPEISEKERERRRQEEEKRRRERELMRMPQEFEQFMQQMREREQSDARLKAQTDIDEDLRRNEVEAEERARQEQAAEQERRRQAEIDRLYSEYLSQLAYFELRSDWPMAIELSRTILELVDHDPTVQTRLLNAYKAQARLLYSQSKFDKAILELNAALDLDLDDSDVYYERGLSYYQKGEYDRALLDLNRAIELNSNPAGYFYGRGLVYHQKQDYHRAVTDYTRAISRDPSKASYYFQRGLSYEWRGANFYNKEDMEMAFGDFDRAVQLDPTRPHYFFQRGMNYRKRGDLRRSTADFDRAIQLDGTQADYYYQRALNNTQNKYHDIAIADYNRAIELDPRQPNYYYYRGLTYKAKKDRKTARRDLQTALDMGHPKARADLAAL